MLPTTNYSDRSLGATSYSDRDLALTTTALKTADGKYVKTSDGYFILVGTLGNLFTSRTLPTTVYTDR